LNNIPYDLSLSGGGSLFVDIWRCTKKELWHWLCK